MEAEKLIEERGMLPWETEDFDKADSKEQAIILENDQANGRYEDQLNKIQLNFKLSGQGKGRHLKRKSLQLELVKTVFSRELK